MQRTKGQLEADISKEIVRFEKNFMGRGPLETKTYILDDLIMVRLRKVLTQAEHQLAKSGKESNGRDLIKQVRIKLLERGRPLLEEMIHSITGKKVVSMHTDISTVTGERIIIFTLASPMQFDKNNYV